MAHDETGRTNDNGKTGDGTDDGADDWTDRWTEENDADDGPTHEGYADFLQLVAPDQTRLDEFRRTRNVQEHVGTLFSAVSIAMVKEAISSSCQTSATRLFWLFWLNRSSALGAALCALGRFSHLGAAGIGQVVSCPLSATCWSATDPSFVISNPL